MERQRRWLGLLAGTALALALVWPVAAYNGQVVTTITVTPSKRTFSCNHFWTGRATVLDQNGNPVAGVKIRWSYSRSPTRRDRILHLTTRTDAAGVARTKYKFACVRGDRRVKARRVNVSGTAVIHVRLRRSSSTAAANTSATGAVLGVTSIGDPDSLPSTSTLTPAVAPPPSDGLPLPAIPALLGVLVGAAIFLRRIAISRR